MVEVEYLNGLEAHLHRAEFVGMIPYWLSEDDEASVSEQLDANYIHGGGWNPFKRQVSVQGHTFNIETGSLSYPGGLELFPLARMNLRDEVIYVYYHSWICIVQRDGSFEVCRMD